MSRIRQYEPVVPPDGPDFSRTLHYDPCIEGDPYAEFTTLLILPTTSNIAGYKDSLGNHMTGSGQCLVDPSPFNFGTRDFTIEISRYQSSSPGYGVPSVYWSYYPIMQQVGGIELLTVTPFDPSYFRVWNGSWFMPILTVPVSKVLALYDKIFHFAISRTKAWIYLHLNGELIDSENVGDSYAVPFSLNSFYFTTYQAENGNRYNSRSSHSRSVRVTSGIARYRMDDRGPDFINTSGARVATRYATHVLKSKSSPHIVPGVPVRQELGCRAFQSPIVGSSFDPAAHSPIVWYDVFDDARLSYEGLKPHPSRLLGKPGVERRFDVAVATDPVIYAGYAQVPYLVKTGILTSAPGSNAITADNFAAYFVFSLQADGDVGGFTIASCPELSFSYQNGRLSAAFSQGGSPLFTEYIDYPVIDGLRPTLCYIKRFGGSWEVGINSQTKQFSYSPGTFSSELTLSVSPLNGDGGPQIFHELLAFVGDSGFAGAKHGQILEYFRAKHGVEYAVSKESIPLDVEFCSGAICDMGDVFFQENAGLPTVRSADNLIYGRAQEASYYSPEDQLDLVFNIDMSDESCLALDASSGVVGYRDKFSGRKFRAVANWGNPIPRAAASWNCRWPIYVPATGESKYYFRSTQRYSANPTGNNLFFVGRPPTVLLSQGISQYATYTSYYGFRFNIVDPWRDANRYHALAIKTEGEWGWQYSYEPIYDFAYTYHQLPADFLPTGLLVEDGSVTAPCVICYSMQGSLKVYINGVDVFPSYYTNLLEWPSGDVLDVFGTNLGMSAMTAECGQAMLVDGALSVGDIQKVSAQLAYKWGIIDRFSPDFPYRNTSPTP